MLSHEIQPVKCNIMQITRKRTNKIEASYTLEGMVLENVYSIKYLGVTITHDFRWNTHISNMCIKANRTLGFLRRNFINILRMLKRQHIGDLFTPFWNMAAVSGIPKTWFFNKKSKKFRIGLLGLLLAITVLKLGVEYDWNTGKTKMRVSQEKEERQQTDSGPYKYWKAPKHR